MVELAWKTFRSSSSIGQAKTKNFDKFCRSFLFYEFLIKIKINFLCFPQKFILKVNFYLRVVVQCKCTCQGGNRLVLLHFILSGHFSQMLLSKYANSALFARSGDRGDVQRVSLSVSSNLQYRLLG